MVLETIFVVYDIKAQAMKAKNNNNKWSYIKLKNVGIAKETINKMRKQPTEWTKIFVIIYPKELLSRIYNKLI